MAVAVAAAVSFPRLVPGRIPLSASVLLARGRGCGVAVRARGQGAATPDPAAILRRPYSKSAIAPLYENGDRLSPEHERAILERLLPYHPQYEKKIGSGIDYITVQTPQREARARLCTLASTS
ncbi:hypothetical protein E2562_002648 [Oryza meyeriana var. granulata]|uniref:Uncharacterized protein n=1 Tax=Oryza meyeriana var. granulata TaxID=110450 RepID=A0A6G1F398_9ORYZ|nr:hypothetical protein E2562_002648 [Oryza meyeriana var. granulata]